VEGPRVLRLLRGGPKGSEPAAWSQDMMAAFTAAKQALLDATCMANLTTGPSISMAVDAFTTHGGMPAAATTSFTGMATFGFLL
jgi:hypothetical protein